MAPCALEYENGEGGDDENARRRGEARNLRAVCDVCAAHVCAAHPPVRAHRSRVLTRVTCHSRVCVEFIDVVQYEFADAVATRMSLHSAPSAAT